MSAAGVEQDAYTVIRYISLVLWAVVMLITRKPTWRFMARRPAHYDIFWAIFFGAALNRVWFVGRGLVYNADVPNTLPDLILSISAYLFGILIASAQITAWRWYGQRR